MINNTKISGRDTSRVVLLNDLMDLDTLVAAHRRETARVLGSQGAPAESDTDPVRSSIQGNLSDFWLIFEDFSGNLQNLKHSGLTF